MLYSTAKVLFCAEAARGELARALDEAGQQGQAEAARAEVQRVSRNLAAAEKNMEAIFGQSGEASAR